MTTAANSGTPNFNGIARSYRILEYLSFGHLLERCRFAQLPQIKTSSNAIVLGDGDGRFIARLLQQNSQLHATAVDASPAMLRLLAENCARVNATDRLTLLHADIRTFTPEKNASYDLIVTHFFLDCLGNDEISALIQRLRNHLTLNAQWLVSEFSVPQNAFRLPGQFLIRMLYAAFGFLTGLRVQQLPDHRRALTAAGFECIRQEDFAAGLLASELWQIVTH